jgi:hypothetical protein
MRWKPVINAFAITFSDRWPAAENYLTTNAETPFLLRAPRSFPTWKVCTKPGMAQKERQATFWINRSSITGASTRAGGHRRSAGVGGYGTAN